MGLAPPLTRSDLDKDSGDRRQAGGVTYGYDANGNRDNTCAYAYGLVLISAT